jgi:hypothetical protein
VPQPTTLPRAPKGIEPGGKEECIEIKGEGRKGSNIERNGRKKGRV